MPGDHMMSTKKTSLIQSRLTNALLCGAVALAMVLGVLGVPLVSSEGMIIRSHLIEGDIPRKHDDPVWEDR